MPRVRIPRYRHYKPKNLGMVVIRGRAHYLGKYGTEASLEEYRRLIADHLSVPASASLGNSPASTLDPSGPTINELLVTYWDRFVRSHYVKDGRPTSEQDNIRQALRFLRRLFGNTAAADFGPRSMVLVRESMIQAGRCRRLINKDVNRIRGLFRWATEQELYPGTMFQALRAVKALARGAQRGQGAAARRPGGRGGRPGHVDPPTLPAPPTPLPTPHPE